MSARRFLIPVLVAVSTFAWAQSNELGGVFGRTFVSDQGIVGATFFNPIVHFGNGFTMEADYARHLTPENLIMLSFELPVALSFDMDLASGDKSVPESYKFFFITPSARFNFFANTRVSPWVSGGGGYGRFAESSNSLLGPNTGPTGTNTGIVQFGAGLDARVWTKFSIRGEVRDFWSGTPQLNVDTGKSRQHNFFVGAGIVWRFGK